jgi:hypothetical protein
MSGGTFTRRGGACLRLAYVTNGGDKLRPYATKHMVVFTQPRVSLPPGTRKDRHKACPFAKQ